MRLEVDEYGYLYVIMPSGEKRYILVDVPNFTHYGKLKFGEPIIEAETCNKLQDSCNKAEDDEVNAIIEAEGEP